MELLNRDKRDGYIYDCSIKGLDSNFWANVTGTPTVSTGKIRLNAATMASFILHEFADIEFGMNIPAVPTSGDSRRFGFFSPAAPNVGAAYFDITGTVFTANVLDASGNLKQVTLTFTAGWAATETIYRITFEKDIVRFWVGTLSANISTWILLTTIAAPQTGLSIMPLPVYIKNGNSDNVDLTYMAVRQAAGIV